MNPRSETPEEPEEEGGVVEEPIYQAVLLFKEFPELDPDLLAQAINSLEPAEEECEVSDFSIGTLDPSSEAAGILPPEYASRRIGTSLITWSSLQLSVVLHDWPASQQTLGFAAIAGQAMPEIGQAIAEHKACALLNCIDTEADMHPIERMILLLKAAIACAEQGALAMVNEHNATFFPGELLKQLGEAARESVSNAPSPEGGPPEEGQELSLWDSLRAEGMPPELLVSLVPVEDDQGRLWFLTRGYAHCELPELAYQANDIAEYEQIDGHLKNIFSYMMENGAVLEPGHTLGYDENALMRFRAPAEDEEFLESPYGTLVVTLEERKSGLEP